MAYFAKTQGDLVVNIIVAETDFLGTLSDQELGQWIETCPNMVGGVYHDPTTNAPAEDQSVINGHAGRMRKNYAGIGYTYDSERDAFIPPKPFTSWVLNEDSCLWEAPASYPDDGEMYRWDEDTTSWQPE